MNDAQLAAIVDMMESNDLLHFSHVLTGGNAPLTILCILCGAVCFTNPLVACVTA